MNTIDNHGEPESPLQGNWLRRNYLSVLIFLFVAAVVIGLFVFFQRKPDKIDDFENYGYLGAFLFSLVSNATVFLPFPGFLAVFSLGATFNPLFIGLAGGIGGGIGELTGYLAGFSGRGIWQDNRTYQRASAWLERRGSLVVFLFAATPLPMDVIGIISGNLRFPLWKFFVACWLGKTVQTIILAYMGKWGWDAVIRQHWDTRTMWIVGVAGTAVLVLLVLALLLERWAWRRGR